MHDLAANADAIIILLVEDDPGDIVITTEALERSKLVHTLRTVSDGEEALRFLHRQGEHADAPRPDLILLDLNLPRVDGRQILSDIKGDESLRAIPVVVLSTSEADDDILHSYNLHANAYVSKPVDFDKFVGIVQQIDEFFLSVVRLPPHRD